MSRPEPALLEPARYPFEHDVTTRFADLDPNDHINNVAMAALLEDGRVRFNNSIGMRAALAGLRAMVASVAIDYLAQGHYPDPVRGLVGVFHVGRSSWSVMQLLVQNGQPIATALSVLVCVDKGAPHALPEAARELLGRWELRA